MRALSLSPIIVMAVDFRCTVVAPDRVECSIVWLESDAARRVSSTVYDLGGHRVTLYGGGESEPSLPAPPAGAVRFVAISDTHTQHRQLPRVPDGDVLLHTGDFTNTGTLEEVQDFATWLATMPHAHKLLVPGNHDLSCDAEWYMSHWHDWHDECQSPAEAARLLSDAGVQILNGTSVTIGGVLVYGSPVQPRMPKQRTQMAFGRARGKELKAEWERLPRGLGVLLTHTPPFGVLDEERGKQLGCEELLRAAKAVKPAVHCFGHIHAGYGTQSSRSTLFVNASSARERRAEGAAAGALLNPPVVFDVEVCAKWSSRA